MFLVCVCVCVCIAGLQGSTMGGDAGGGCGSDQVLIGRLRFTEETICSEMQNSVISETCVILPLESE
jgi:hypothetical protein